MQPSPSLFERIKRLVQELVATLSRRSTYVAIAAALLVLLLGGTVVIWFLEQDRAGEGALRDWQNSFTFMLQNVAGVGIGAQAPRTIGGRIAGISFVLLGAALRAVLIAAIVSWFVNRILVQGKGVKRVDLKDHILICGWNPRIWQIIKVLQQEAFGAGVPIVLLAALPENPLQSSRIKFVSGNPTHAEDLQRAGVMSARAAIAVTDESDHDPHTDSTYDAHVVLTVLALKQANPNLHVVAQMRDPANRVHFERARANEVIASSELSEGLLARSAINVGIANAFGALLRLDTPQEMYVIDTPEILKDKTFQAALVHYQLRSGNILVGVVEDGQTLLCPPPGYRLNSATRLVVLGNVRPKLDH